MELENAWVDFTVTRGPIRGKDRNRVGLLVRVRARRDVEDFMSALGQNRRVQVDAVGDGWQNCGLEGGSLEFYDADTRFDGQRIYTLDNIAGPLIINPVNDRHARLAVAPQEDIVNLSFLRLAGISDESGVTVGLIGAYSGDYLKRMKNMLPNAIKQFLQDYIVPMTINLQVISKS